MNKDRMGFSSNPFSELDPRDLTLYLVSIISSLLFNFVKMLIWVFSSDSNRNRIALSIFRNKEYKKKLFQSFNLWQSETRRFCEFVIFQSFSIFLRIWSFFCSNLILILWILIADLQLANAQIFDWQIPTEGGPELQMTTEVNCKYGASNQMPNSGFRVMNPIGLELGSPHSPS